MKSFIEYISEQETIVPAVSRIPEPLPFGFSIKGDPVGKKKPNTNKPKKSQQSPSQQSPSQQSPSTQSLTFAERLRLAKERANIQ